MSRPDLADAGIAVTMLARTVPDFVERTVHVLSDGRPLQCDSSWRDVFAVVEHGGIELETTYGARLRLVEGDAFCFALTGPVLIRNTDTGRAVLTAVRRRTRSPSSSHCPTQTPSSTSTLQLAGTTESRQPPSADPRRRHIMDMKLELVPVPVTDVDRAKAFYTDLVGFVCDVDVQPTEGMRVVQLTPPGSACSIVIGTGLGELSDLAPGTIRGLHLVVDGIERAREELRQRGVDVAEIDDVGRGVRYARFADPDGNSLLLQEMSWRTGDNF